MKSIFAAAVAGLLASPVDASLLTFSDRAAWRAAVGGGIGDRQENFNSFTEDTSWDEEPVNAGFLTISKLGKRGLNFIDVPPKLFQPLVDGTPAALLISDQTRGTRFAFDSPIQAVGFDIGALISDDATARLYEMTTSLGDAVSFSSIPDIPQFFGIVYTMGESTTYVDFSSTTNNLAASDNWEAFSATNAPIPEPSAYITWAMLGMCIGAGYWWRRRNA